MCVLFLPVPVKPSCQHQSLTQSPRIQTPPAPYASEGPPRPDASTDLLGATGTRYRVPAYGTSGAAAAARRLPQEWATHVAAARDEIAWTLQALNPNVLELCKVWFESGYSAARLVDVESGDFVSRLPAQVRDRTCGSAQVASVVKARRAALPAAEASCKLTPSSSQPLTAMRALSLLTRFTRLVHHPTHQAEAFRTYQLAVCDMLKSQLW